MDGSGRELLEIVKEYRISMWFKVYALIILKLAVFLDSLL